MDYTRVEVGGGGGVDLVFVFLVCFFPMNHDVRLRLEHCP
jgi:hypothetical protein